LLGPVISNVVPRASVHRMLEIFRVLKDRELRALWFADWINDAGNFVTFIALAVYINNLTGSATAVGFALALRTVPWFTLGPFAGVLVDRLDRRSVMIGTCVIRAVLVGMLPFTHSVWQAYALSFSSSLFGPLFRPARSALLAQVARDGTLVPVLAVTETTHQVLHTVGPALGGLAVLLVGARHAFFLDAASFVIAAGFVTAVRPRGRSKRERSSTMNDLHGGFRALFTAPAVRTYTLLSAGLNLGFAGVIALLVVYVRDVLGRAGGQYGLVLSMAGVGTVVTSVIIAARDDRHSRAPWALLSVAGIGSFVLAWLEPSFFWLFPIAFAAGLADAGVGIPMAATLAEELSDEFRGRANSVQMGVFALSEGIGSLGFAWLGETGRLGAAHAMGVAALVGAGLGMAVLLMGGASAITRHEHQRLATTRSEET
jgi:predicted MFS family arabinose efflux permease